MVVNIHPYMSTCPVHAHEIATSQTPGYPHVGLFHSRASQPEELVHQLSHIIPGIRMLWFVYSHASQPEEPVQQPSYILPGIRMS